MQKLLHIFAFAIVSFIAFCMLYLQVFPILHDYPEWMYQGWIFSELLLAENAALAERFQLVSYPIPNSISQVSIGLLNTLVSPVLAGKLWLACYLLFASVLWFVISCHKTTRFGGAFHLLLTVLITLGPGFWNGYINFQFGLLFFALFLYLTVWRRVRSYAVLFVFSLLIFFSHAIVFAIFVVFNFVCLFADRRDHSKGVLIALFPSVLLTCWYAVIKLATTESTGAPGFTALQWVQYKAYTLAKQGPFHNFIGPDGKSTLEDLPLIYQAGFVSNFLVAFVLICWFCYLVWSILQRQAGRLYHLAQDSGIASGNTSGSAFLWPVIVTIGVALAAFLAGSQNLYGVVNIGERFLILALLMALLFFQCPNTLRGGLVVFCTFISVYTVVATLSLSKKSIEIYSVERSSEINDLQQYLGDIYSNTRHKHFNHRVFIYADRGVELTHDVPVLLAVDLPTSVVKNR